MSIGILIVSHPGVGQSLLDTAVAIIGSCPIPTRVLPVPMDNNQEHTIQQANKYIHELDQGDGVLILTDLYGATPSNIACGLRNSKVSIVSGINLPMLIRILNYPDHTLEQLTEKALSGGYDGILSPSAGEQH